MACTLFVLFVAGYRPWCPRLDGGEALLLGCAAGIAALVLGARAVDGLGMAHWVLAVAALWVAWSYATAFGIARTGRGASSGGGAPGTFVDDVGVRLVGPARWVLLRSVVVRPVFFWGCLLLAAFSTGGSAATLLIASTYFVFMSLHDGLGAIRALAPLPISPARLFRTSTFPSFCVVVACHLLNARVRAVNWNSPSYQFLVESGHAADPAGVEPWSSLLLATLAWFLGCAVLLETLLAVHDSGQPRRGYRPRLSVGAIYACVVLVFLVVEFAGSSSAVMGAVQGAGALFGGSWVGWILLITALVWAADVALTRSFARIEVGTCLLDPWPGRPRPAR
jgi:hypothetical protein